VANHFYKGILGDFIVLQCDPAKLKAEVKFEAAAAVGDQETYQKTAGEVLQRTCNTPATHLQRTCNMLINEAVRSEDRPENCLKGAATQYNSLQHSCNTL